MSTKFNGVKVFSATMLRDREVLGEKVTEWLRENPSIEIVDRVVTQSSDESHHCIAITLFFVEQLRPAAAAGRRLAFKEHG